MAEVEEFRVVLGFDCVPGYVSSVFRLGKDFGERRQVGERNTGNGDDPSQGMGHKGRSHSIHGRGATCMQGTNYNPTQRHKYAG